MKRIAMIVVVMALLAGGMVFATGQAEEAQTPWQQGYYEEFEEIALKGSFTLSQGFPALETADGTFTLGAPRAAWIAQSIEEGTEMEVQGYLIEEVRGARGGWAMVPEGVEGHVRVTEATLDGKSYVLDDGFGAMGGPGMMGRGGMMHRGPGHRGMMGGGYAPQGRFNNYGPRGGMMGGGYAPRADEAPNWNQNGGYGRRW